MYNRYIPNGNTYTRITEREPEPPTALPSSLPERPAPRQAPPAPAVPRRPASSSGGSGSPLAGLTGLLDAFRPEELDSGDILLILILLFLFRDGDDIELLITLGLILLLGPEEKPDQTP